MRSGTTPGVSGDVAGADEGIWQKMVCNELLEQSRSGVMAGLTIICGEESKAVLFGPCPGGPRKRRINWEATGDRSI
jgi:hypothetical protein